MNRLQNRRQFIRNAGYLTLGVALLGCGETTEETATIDDGGGSGGSGGTGGTVSQAPLWNRIPTQAWIVGVPVYLDLADYVTDPDGDALTILLDRTLPPGVTLNGSVISGTPTLVAESATYVATADDGDA